MHAATKFFLMYLRTLPCNPLFLFVYLLFFSLLVFAADWMPADKKPAKECQLWERHGYIFHFKSCHPEAVAEYYYPDNCDYLYDAFPLDEFYGHSCKISELIINDSRRRYDHVAYAISNNYGTLNSNSARSIFYVDKTKEFNYICPPTGHPEYTIGPVEDENGTKWCLKPQETVYCPADKPYLDAENGCYGDEPVAPKECGAGNPVLIADGRKVQLEPVDLLLADGLFSLQRRYLSRTENDNSLFVAPYAADRAPPMAVAHQQPTGYRVGRVAFALPKVSYAANAVRLLGDWQFIGLAKISFTANKAVRNEGGQQHLFTRQDDGSYLSHQLNGQRLLAHGDGWLLQTQPGVREYFDATGRLSRWEKNNRVVMASYTPQGQLHTLNSGAAELVFGYDDSGRLTTATLGDKQVTYSYDALNRLVAVSRNDGRVRQYHYEDPRFPEALTGITDERGVRYASFQYDAQGRAIDSRHGEADRYQFVFGDNQTTVINPLGKETIYRYSNLSGIKRLTAIEGVPSESCAGANKAYSYYPNGQLQTRTDWQGVITRFEYNSRGLVSREIEAEGTPEQRETRYDYHPLHPWPVRITSGLNITEYDYDDLGNLRATRVLPH